MASTSKKIWLAFCAILIAILLLFIFLPLQSNVHEQVKIKANVNALNRQFVRDTSWHNWWPGKVELKTNTIVIHQGEFTFKRGIVYLNKIAFEVSSGSFSTPATLNILPEANGDITISFNSAIELERNPIKRIQSLLLSYNLKKAFEIVLKFQSVYFSSATNLYDVDIKEDTVHFQFYATLTKNFPYEPSLKEEYTMIEEVKRYIKRNQSTEKGPPMLNVTKMINEFFTQVAIPTDINLPSIGDVKTKWMLKGGHILKAEVKGGTRLISNAKQQVKNYIFDNHRREIAIPFESLITNRLEQPDTSKWITEIYFPVYF